MVFSAPMVRAILEGRKTQTRRIVKPQPFTGIDDKPHRHSRGTFTPEVTVERDSRIQPGDVLWVRETWRPNQGAFTPEADYNEFGVDYRADGRTLWFDCDDLDLYPHGDKDVDKAKWLPRRNGDDIWRSPIHMPRWASRLRLLVKSVRVERLQDISEEDALAEGIDRPEDLKASDVDVWEGAEKRLFDALNQPLAQFRRLWESIHGPGSWDVNPWVWVYEWEPIK